MVYNNFPWLSASVEQRERVEAQAPAVLAAREKFVGTAPAPGAVADALVGNTEGALTSTPAPKQSARARTATAGAAVLPRNNCTLADLYDPLAMPPELKAHTELDRAVEKCYRPEPFRSDRERVEFLFSLYEKLTVPLLPPSGSGVHAEPQLKKAGADAHYPVFPALSFNEVLAQLPKLGAGGTSGNPVETGPAQWRQLPAAAPGFISRAVTSTTSTKLEASFGP